MTAKSRRDRRPPVKHTDRPGAAPLAADGAVALEAAEAADTTPVSRRIGLAYRRLLPWVDVDALEANNVIVRAWAMMEDAFNLHLAQFKLNRSRYMVLRVIYFSEDRRVPLSLISRGLYVTSANVTQVMQRLERDGWVRRVTSSEDRRVVYAEFTPEGEAQFEEIMPSTVSFLQSFWDGFSPDEIRQTRDVLYRYQQNLAERLEKPGD